MDANSNEAKYLERLPLLTELAKALELRCVELLQKHNVAFDRIYFRAKTADSFLAKCVKREDGGQLRYKYPLEEIEDQVGGRILVLFETDIAQALDALQRAFNSIESVRKLPKKEEEFGYDSHHLVVTIPPEVKSRQWIDTVEMPTTFELQVRTLFMHAWAEPQHNFSYKGQPLSSENKRKLAWIAASAWGADRVFEEMRNSANDG